MNITNKTLEELSYDLEIDETEGMMARVYDGDVVEDIIELTKDMIVSGEEFGEVEATRPTSKELGLALVRANREARR